MSDDVNYMNNPLHGVGLKDVLVELVDHYGFEILFAYLSINCFKTKPTIDSSIKFLKKTDWAREKVEGFYLYQFKNLPRASFEQFSLPPRDRIVPEGQLPGEPAELSLEDAERLREKRAKKSAEHGGGRGRSGSGKRPGAQRSGGYSNKRGKDEGRKDESESSNESSRPARGKVDPWANSRK